MRPSRTAVVVKGYSKLRNLSPEMLLGTPVGVSLGPGRARPNGGDIHLRLAGADIFGDVGTVAATDCADF
jgi:hypothetical protein